MASIGLSPPGDLPGILTGCDGSRCSTMLVHRFNAQPMTIQCLRCCLSSPHRICSAVSMAVVPSRRSVPCLAPGNRFVREALLLSCQDSSRGESVRFTPLLIKRGQVAPLFRRNRENIFPPTKSWGHIS